VPYGRSTCIADIDPFQEAQRGPRSLVPERIRNGGESILLVNLGDTHDTLGEGIAGATFPESLKA